MEEVTIPPDLEELLQEAITHPGKLYNSYKRYRILGMLDKLINLQMRKLVTLQNLRDALHKQMGG